MTPDIVYGWLKCVGYGLGLIVAGWIFWQKVKDEKVVRDSKKRDCRNCKHCKCIENDGYIRCGYQIMLSGYYPRQCSGFEWRDNGNESKKEQEYPTVYSELRKSDDGEIIQTYRITGIRGKSI